MSMTPVDVWLAITTMPRPSVVVDFPRKNANGESVGQLRLRVLTQEEQMTCSADAERYTKKAIKEIPKADEAQTGYSNVYNNAAAVEVLYQVCRNKDDVNKPFFPSPEAIRKALTPDEVGVLMMNYYTAQAELGPIVAYMTEPEQDAFVTVLAEGGKRFPLDLLSSEQVKDLAFSLACRIHKFMTASISPGSPQGEGSTNPPPPPQE